MEDSKQVRKLKILLIILLSDYYHMNTIGAPKTIEATTAEKKPSKEYYLERMPIFASTKSIAMVVHCGTRKAHRISRGEPDC